VRVQADSILGFWRRTSLEEVATKLETSRLRATFLALFVATCAAQIGMGIIAPIFPLYARGFSASAFSIGVVFAAFSAARAFVAPLVGRISDRTDRKRIMLAGLVAYGAVSILFVFATSLWHLGVFRFLQGAAAVMVTPVAQAYVGDLTPAGSEGKYINVFYSSMFIGMALGPLIGGGVAELWSYKAVFLVMAALSFGALALVAVVLPRNTKADRKAAGASDPTKTGTEFRDPGVRTLLVYWITRGFWQQGFNTFYPLFAASVAGFSESSIGLVLTVQLVAGGLLQIPFGWLADRYRRLPQIAVGAVISPLALLSIQFVHQLWAVLSLAFAMGVLDALSRASMLAERVERGREHGMGVMAGLQSGAFGVGQMLGPLACGALVDVAGIQAMLPFAASIGMVGAVLTIFWYSSWQRKQLRNGLASLPGLEGKDRM
jgi:DHA1 family multidrug resistance protein-like MFS transporter